MLNTISNFWADNGMNIMGYILSFIGGALIFGDWKGGDNHGKS